MIPCDVFIPVTNGAGRAEKLLLELNDHGNRWYERLWRGSLADGGGFMARQPEATANRDEGGCRIRRRD
jgi:hypothetical protein